MSPDGRCTTVGERARAGPGVPVGAMYVCWEPVSPEHGHKAGVGARKVSVQRDHTQLAYVGKHPFAERSESHGSRITDRVHDRQHEAPCGWIHPSVIQIIHPNDRPSPAHTRMRLELKGKSKPEEV